MSVVVALNSLELDVDVIVLLDADSFNLIGVMVINSTVSSSKGSVNEFNVVSSPSSFFRLFKS